MKADESLLASLHGHLTEEFLRRIRSGEASPSDLNAARQFLRDNGITCLPEANLDVQDLASSLPSMEDIDMMAVIGRPLN